MQMLIVLDPFLGKSKRVYYTLKDENNCDCMRYDIRESLGCKKVLRVKKRNLSVVHLVHLSFPISPAFL